MARPNGRGGWDITDEEAAEVIAASSDRSKAENADRLEAMAAEALMVNAELAATEDERARLTAALLDCRAECERLRVIVDLAIAVTHPQTREQWRKAQLPFVQAVEAEVERRG